MKVIALQSGSNGNAIYVEAGDARILIDAGISGEQARQRLAAHGRDISAVDALLISHDHRDHSCCLGVYHRKFGLPIYITPGTLTVARKKMDLGHLRDIRHFQAGSKLCIAGLTIETIPTPHDAVDGVAFVLDDGRCRLGVLTDLGHAFVELIPAIRSLDAVIIESNYDPAALERSAYPEGLKQRIRGPGGHLSNDEAAELLNLAATTRLQWACLAHLSADSNDPATALDTHRRLQQRPLPLSVASRYAATDVLEVHEP